MEASPPQRDRAQTGGVGGTKPATEKAAASELRKTAGEIAAALDLQVGKPTDTFAKWQQYPAWALGALSFVVAGLLIIVDPENSAESGWVFAIIALFLAVVLSYRSAFTFGRGDAPQKSAASPGDGKKDPSRPVGD